LEKITIILIGEISELVSQLLIYFLLRYHRPGLVSIVKRVAYSDFMKLVAMFSTIRNYTNKNIDHGCYSAVVALELIYFKKKTFVKRLYEWKLNIKAHTRSLTIRTYDKFTRLRYFSTQSSSLDVAHSAPVFQKDQFPNSSHQKRFYEPVNSQMAPVFYNTNSFPLHIYVWLRTVSK